MVSSALSATKATGMSTACLSWLGIAAWGGAWRNSPTVRDGSSARVSQGIEATYAWTACRSAAVSPLVFSTTRR